ncbi:hypothetical protein PHMEG_0002326 [Phytophthora megakarya]|uniref:Uncharacterized protein n=1 Tax=Phytophthora megakarya TaxID=4795 RepID=A0A225WYZ6_9STRA|nr:hypothetical protein PHMEG_0002326 [Phytophthora megakarya]
MLAFFVKTAAVAVAVLSATSEAHNKMTLPLPTWPEGVYNQNSPSGTIDPSKVMPAPSGMSYNTDSASNTKAYWTAFNASKYKSLKEFAWDTQTLEGSATKECGFSIVDGTARDLPAKVQWDFFTASHQGPCEVWCDDTLVFENWNCAVDYPDTPANLPYEKAKCKGSSVLTSYWIALHTTPWQVYTNCAKLSGGSATSNSSTTTDSSSDTEQTTTAPSTPTVTTAPSTPSTPTATTAPTTDTTQTEASSDGESAADDDSSAGDDASASTDAEAETTAPTEAPATTTAPTVDKCSVRRRRH